MSRKQLHSENRAAAHGFSFDTLIGAVLARSGRIITILTAGAVITVVILLLIPNKYTSTASIMPTGTQDQLSSLKNLAGLSGLIPNDENSSELFPDILASRLVADVVLHRAYVVPSDDGADTVVLSDYFGEENPDKLRQELSAARSIRSDASTGIIRLAVETTRPQLSQMIVQAHLDALDRFNRFTRRSKAGEQAKYLAAELIDQEIKLRLVEDSLKRVQTENRNWASTTNPDLQFELRRLERSVEINSQVYLVLRKEFELARLEAAKDVPLLQLLDAPSLPIEKSGPKRLLILIAVLIATGSVTIAGYLAEAVYRRWRTTDDGESLSAYIQEQLAVGSPRLHHATRRILRWHGVSTADPAELPRRNTKTDHTGTR